MEDRLDEAIHVLRNHAVGQTAAMPANHGDMHSLLGSAPGHSASVGGLSQAFPTSVMPLGNRHSSLVSQDTGGDGCGNARRQGLVLGAVRTRSPETVPAREFTIQGPVYTQTCTDLVQTTVWIPRFWFNSV